jgi:hypothetical protein
MGKLILMSIIIGMIIIPTRAAREPDPRKGLRKVVKEMLIFEVIYLLALRYVWGRFE